MELTVIIRSVEERTEAACSRIVERQLGTSSKVDIIRGLPFAEAHFASIHKAIESGTRWALFLDADVLLRSGAVARIVTEAEKLGPDFCMLNFRILDKGFGGPAYGTHLYSIKHLEKTLAFFHHVRSSQRPETALYFKVSQIGIPSYTSGSLMGIHGYEQYYRDLYRTAFVRAVKFGSRLAYFLKRYRKAFHSNSSIDNWDDIVILCGLLDGLVEKASGRNDLLDERFYRERAAAALKDLGIEEKDDLLNFGAGDVDGIVDSFTPDALYLENSEWICPEPGKATPAPEPALRLAMKNYLRLALLNTGVRAKAVIKRVL